MKQSDKLFVWKMDRKSPKYCLKKIRFKPRRIYSLGLKNLLCQSASISQIDLNLLMKEKMCWSNN